MDRKLTVTILPSGAISYSIEFGIITNTEAVRVAVMLYRIGGKFMEIAFPDTKEDAIASQ